VVIAGKTGLVTEAMTVVQAETAVLRARPKSISKN
jgi:hypothetical protein